jgi:hypothetical protein
MKTTLTLLTLAATVLAKTDLEGCTSSQTVAFGGASMIYWDPTNGEICSFLDCGGGRAPPKTTVPGCDGYKGTATYSPDFLPGWGSASATSAPSASSVESESEVEEPTTAAGVSVPAYETKTESAESTLVTSKAVLPSGVAAGSGLPSGYSTGVVTTKAGNLTASTGSPSATGAPEEHAGAGAKVAAPLALVMGVLGLAML